MTRDDIIRMAREAGLMVETSDGWDVWQPDNLEQFAAVVAAAEREACAKVCDELEASMQNGKRTKDGNHAAFTAGIIAERIRARGAP
jgi:hypothetical protein